MNRDREDEAESRRIIGRVGAESEASMARRVASRIGGHMAGRDVREGDAGGGVGLLVYIIWWLVDFSSSGGG
jgi:hypothetical protein